MFFALITLITALSMATVAAWFAIAGIMAVFAGAPIPALIMGIVVEAGKIIGVSWIYRYWKEKTKLKWAMVPVVIVATLLTSMGIFGFLSKAHIEQNAPVGNNIAKIERLDKRVTREQSRIDDAELIIDQLDEQIQVLINFNKISHPEVGSRAVQARQKEQRDALAQTINEAEDKIDAYEDEKLILNAALRQLEIEVGPVKYIAEIIYEDAETNLDRAVRAVIIAFVFVFDPMAILLLMGANFIFMQIRPKDEEPEPPTSFKVEPSAENPGEKLINLIDDSKPEKVKPEVKAKPEVKIPKKSDRAWLASIPKKNENVTGEMLQNAMGRLKNRDLSNDEQILMKRLRKIATARGVPWDIARQVDIKERAAVTTKNPILTK